MSFIFRARVENEEERRTWIIKCAARGEKKFGSYEAAVTAWNEHGKGLCPEAKAKLQELADAPEAEREELFLAQRALSPEGHDMDFCEYGPELSSYIPWENPIMVSEGDDDYDMKLVLHEQLNDMAEKLWEGVNMSYGPGRATLNAIGIVELPLKDSGGVIEVGGEPVYSFHEADDKWRGEVSLEEAWNSVLREMNPGFEARTVADAPYSGDIDATKLLAMCSKVPERYGHDHGTVTETWKGAGGANVIANGRPEGYVNRMVDELSALAVFAEAIGAEVSWS